MPGLHDIFGKQFDSFFFVMNIQAQPVDAGIIVIGLDEVQCQTVVSRLDGAKGFHRQHHTGGGQFAENRLADIDGHSRQTTAFIIKGHILVLVVIHISDIHLAQMMAGIIAPRFREHTNLQPPVTGNPDSAQYIGPHGKLTRQGIAVTVQVFQVIMQSNDLFQCPKQRCHQQPANPPVDGAVGYTGVIPLAKFIIEPGMGHRINQFGQQITLVGHDIAIMQRNGFCAAFSQQIAKAVPDVAPLAHLLGFQTKLPQLVIHLAQSRTIVPEHHMVLWQHTEKRHRLAVLAFIGTVQANHDF